MTANFFYLKITSPNGLVFGGNVLSISAYNASGKFDILKNHTNFITTISKQIEIVDDAGNPKTFTVDKGVIRAVANIVDVYLGIGE